jgi:hypothetical protein
VHTTANNHNHNHNHKPTSAAASAAASGNPLLPLLILAPLLLRVVKKGLGAHRAYAFRFI